MEHEHESGTSKHSKMHPETPRENADPLVQDENLDFSSSSSSSSSFQFPVELISDEKGGLDDSLTNSEKDDFRSPEPDYESLPDFTAQTPEWGMLNESPMLGGGHLSSLPALPQTPEWSTQSESSMKPPLMQTMGQPAGYDPNRIPLSIFTNKPATPMEWSATSNESLFSIHMGNSSFSRDHAVLFGKSGELAKTDEYNSVSYNQHSDAATKSNEPSNSPCSLPTVVEAAAENEETSTTEEDSKLKQEAIGDPKIVLKEIAKDRKEKMPLSERNTFSPASSSVSDGKGLSRAETPHALAGSPRLSNESGNSCSSFAFPILAGDVGKEIPAKAVSEQPELKPQTPETTSNPAKMTGWFSCFSSCPIGCCS